MCRAHPGGGVDSAKGFGGFGGLPHPGHPAAASLPVAVSKNSCTCVLAGVNLHHWPSGGYRYLLDIHVTLGTSLVPQLVKNLLANAGDAREAGLIPG